MYTGKIRALCAERNMSITDFEKEAGLANGIVGKWDTAKFMPRYDTLLKAAKFFGVTVDELLREEKEDKHGAK